ncbi:MAG TPA: hypothetical protein VFH78_07540 [Candidatus Thermoplasmatota archaeon]|nr:hypothetical protein [Candidatus Thermoplasmatota archaeon]
MTDGITLVPGDVLKIERRFLVDGVVQKQTDRGVFAGVQVVGSAEHLVLHKGSKKRLSTRLVPLHSVSEITLVKAMPRRPKVVAPSFDPSVG